ncbi:hypothetical protein HK097_008432 [Rhizophlyctis rosea]|uniref:Uncharacterized protein n=1 Tax=Rhizophlyctis rosea TaxID=64517 RepID=A0AAD5SAD7_9FUNG|nr:hypothetical protein HK097_008432 [Rhizophlyctis rosea]
MVTTPNKPTASTSSAETHQTSHSCRRINQKYPRSRRTYQARQSHIAYFYSRSKGEGGNWKERKEKGGKGKGGKRKVKVGKSDVDGGDGGIPMGIDK